MATTNICNNLHFLCRQIELVGIFPPPGKIYNNRNLSLPHLHLLQTTKADRDDCRHPLEAQLRTLQDGRAPSLFSSLSCSLYCKGKRKNIKDLVAKQEKSQQQDMHRQLVSKKERMEASPVGRRRRDTPCCFLGLDTGLRNSLSVLLPPSHALGVYSSCLHFLSQLPLASLPDPPLLCPGPAEGHCR